MAGDPQALIKKADQALDAAGRGGFLSFMSNKEEKYENAVELYKEAGNAYKRQKMYTQSGETLEKAAKIEMEKLNEPDDAANTLIEASKAYKMENPQAAARCLHFSVDQYCKRGNFRRAAKYMDEIGQMYENDLNEPRKALESYQEAASWYEGDDAPALASALHIKIADLAGLEGDYDTAIRNYEKAASTSRFQKAEYLLKAGICHLCKGSPMYEVLPHYSELGLSEEMKEHILLSNMDKAMAANDQDGFTGILFEYNKTAPLDKWKTAMLVRVKNNIIQAEEEGDDFS